MEIIEIMSKSLILLFEHFEKRSGTSLVMLKQFEEDDIYYDKMEAALTTMQQYGLVSFWPLDRSEFYAKIKGKGIFLVEKCAKDKNNLHEELEILLSESKIINSNIAIKSSNINQEINNDE